MPTPQPFTAVRFASLAPAADLSTRIAPPYDVLDETAKTRLLARDPRNIVAVDLPHLRAKTVGPAEVYAAAASTYREWLSSGVLSRDDRPAMFVYRQSFLEGATPRSRTGIACTIDLVHFGQRPAGTGGAVLPHEETFSGPKQDRLELMRATRAQLSPIFGLHEDASARCAALLREWSSGPAETTARTDDGVTHELWPITDPARIAAYQAAFAADDVFIADGHHRYTTALMYLAERQSAAPLPPADPARRCLFVLVPMSDPGLRIQPTHRVLGGMSAYSWDAFRAAAAASFSFTPVPPGLDALDRAVRALPADQPGFGVLDLATSAAAIIAPTHPDPLAALYPEKPIEWRRLDVALIQYLLVEDICQPALNEGGGVRWAFPHALDQVRRIADGRDPFPGAPAAKPQLAVLVRPTPLASVRAVSRADALMPQKSTFFAPKLATGLFIHPLD